MRALQNENPKIKIPNINSPLGKGLTTTRRSEYFGLQSLNLSRLGLTVVPEQVGLLVSLRQLNFALNSLKTLPPELANLCNLKVLSINGNAELDMDQKTLYHILKNTSLQTIFLGKTALKETLSSIGIAVQPIYNGYQLKENGIQQYRQFCEEAQKDKILEENLVCFVYALKKISLPQDIQKVIIDLAKMLRQIEKTPEKK
jgi:hypothetical protein